MRAVLDTNAIVSATLIRKGNENRILRAWQQGRFDLVLSLLILEEMARVVSYGKLRRARWMGDDEVAELLLALARASILVAGQVRLRVSRDAEDDKFLAAAVEGGAQFLVTGDRDLLDLESHGRVRIVTPAHFLRVLSEIGSPAAPGRE